MERQSLAGTSHAVFYLPPTFPPSHFTSLPLSLPPSGISTFASHPEKAFDSLRPLLDYATLHIPSSKHSETSLYILCTAGMRLLPSEEQERITSLLHRAISATYPFHLPQDGIEVIPGKLEGRNTHLLWGRIMQGVRTSLVCLAMA